MNTSQAASSAAHEPRGFRHGILPYRGDDGFVDATLPLIMEGMAAREAILVVVQQRKVDPLRAQLGSQAGAVRFADMSDVGRNPSRLIPLWREFVDAHSSGGRAVRGIGEPVWLGRSSAERAEWYHHEALLNLAFRDQPEFMLLCPYDLKGLGQDVIRRALVSHPFLLAGTNHHRTDHDPLSSASAVLSEALPPPDPAAGESHFTVETMKEVRDRVRIIAVREGLSGSRTNDLTVAISEAAANSVRHGGGEGTLRIWRQDDRLVSEVRDRGRITDPLIGRRRPSPACTGGRGVWLMNQLCDLVQVRSSDTGTVVRLHTRLA